MKTAAQASRTHNPSRLAAIFGLATFISMSLSAAILMAAVYIH